ncbi:hypothetical protein C8F04DRAFT_1182888 [Mycena alexandri]|uniref:Uncharacterized protein n=1 Tax=Mycena alexandri TaxID=1745969 RepID=A0AAD6T015_9AGAR|nr:hypothetical protein C8F04DRAFT_1196234 [Mycena alexandri]KAJ7034887.1 hypothetical protein C8F04DRAFT_1182888 [Mycena alexandri]
MYMALNVHYGPWTPPHPRSRAHGRSPRLAAVELKENGEAVSGNENLETSSGPEQPKALIGTLKWQLMRRERERAGVFKTVHGPHHAGVISFRACDALIQIQADHLLKIHIIVGKESIKNWFKDVKESNEARGVAEAHRLLIGAPRLPLEYFGTDKTPYT